MGFLYFPTWVWGLRAAGVPLWFRIQWRIIIFLSHDHRIGQFWYIKIQPKTIDLSARLRVINTDFVGLIPRSLVLRFIILGWILICRNWSIPQWNFMYGEFIHAKGAPPNNWFGFNDGTIRRISRPGQHQRLLYNGHKRVLSLKFSSVALPNWLIWDMYGSVGKLC